MSVCYSIDNKFNLDKMRENQTKRSNSMDFEKTMDFAINREKKPDCEKQCVSTYFTYFSELKVWYKKVFNIIVPNRMLRFNKNGKRYILTSTSNPFLCAADFF